MTAAGDAGANPWSKLEIPDVVQLGDCPMGFRIPWGAPCAQCGATRNEACRPYPTALEARVARLAAELAAARAEAAKARDAALEEAARIVETMPKSVSEPRTIHAHEDLTSGGRTYIVPAQTVMHTRETTLADAAKAIRAARTSGGDRHGG